jgi:DNA-binding MarR family transcriptional regulator
MSIIDPRIFANIRHMEGAEAIVGMADATAASIPDLFEDLSFLLARSNALSLAAGNAALSPYGLRVRSYSVLALSAGGRRPSQRELAELLRLDPSQVVALVDELQARDLVIRQPDPGDRRANVVTATDEGAALCEKATAAVAGAQATVFASLSSDQRHQLATLLRSIAMPAS